MFVLTLLQTIITVHSDNSPAASAGCDSNMTQLMFVLYPHRSRQLELEDKQSMLETELRKYMEIIGA